MAAMLNRRHALTLVAAALLPGGRATAQGSAASSSLDPYSAMRWRRGIEGQRRADLGDGRFLNPIIAGDHADPALLRDGRDYYLTFSSMDANPGLLIWHSRDLVNWTPIGPALRTPLGSVWAPDLARHGERYYCYIPARDATRRSVFVITAERIEGPWSEPVDLHLPAHIDPCHVADNDGSRWLFLSGGDRVRLSADGLSTFGAVEHVYDPWHYPADWVVEAFAPEGPKITRRGEFWYMVTAVGGTAGPPTGHMVIVARSRSLAGPWENCPHNPLVRTASAREKWWSRGHATLTEGPRGDWWMIYHGYENGYWTLGRQTLLQPIRWGSDGWPRAHHPDLSKPLAKPIDLGTQAHGLGLSDDFHGDSLGLRWNFYDAALDEAKRWRLADGALQLRAKGSSPSDCSPLSCIAGDQAYRVTVELEIEPGSEGGLLLFYNRRLYAGLGLNARGLVMHRYGMQRRAALSQQLGSSLQFQLTNDHNIVTLHWRRSSNEPWQKFDVQMEVSGYHHNVAYDFLSLRPSLYAAGNGEVRFRNFRYEAL